MVLFIHTVLIYLTTVSSIVLAHISLFTYKHTHAHTYIHTNSFNQTCEFYMITIFYNSVYIYSHPHTDLFPSIRTHQCGLTYKFPVAGIETRLTQRPIQDSTPQLRVTSSSKVNFRRL